MTYDTTLAETDRGWDEQQVLSGLRRGDDDAYEVVFRRYGGRMLSTARRLLGNDEDARDAVQEAMLSAFKAVGRFEGGAQIGTWLHRIVVNAALMKLRARSRRPEVALDEASLVRLERARGPGGWSSTADEALSRRELEAVVREEVARLPDEHRAVLVLRDVEGFDVAEIASLLDVGPAAAKMRLQHARRMLRAALGLRLAPSEAP